MEKLEKMLESAGRIARMAMYSSMVASTLFLYSCDSNKDAEKPAAVQSESNVPVARHKATALISLIEDYRSARNEITKSEDSGLFANSIDRTLKGLEKWKANIVDSRGLFIPPDLYAKSGVAKFGDIFSSDKYWDMLKKGMEGYGMLISGRITTADIDLLAKKFYDSKKSFPSDAFLVTGGQYKGFFVTIGGNLVVPGVSFYRDASENKTASFKTTPFYFQSKYADAREHVRQGDYDKAEKELGEIIRQNLVPRDILSNVYENRAEIYLSGDRFSEAKHDLEWARGLSGSEVDRTMLSGKIRFCESMIGFMQQQKKQEGMN